MTTTTSRMKMLSSAWETVLLQVVRRRSKLHYKPAALLVMLDMIDQGMGHDGRIEFREYNDRFRNLVGPIDSHGAESGWQPFLHLATGAQVWDLYRNGKRVDLDALLANRTKASVEGSVDEARIHTPLVKFLQDKPGRDAVRQAVLKMLAEDKPGDSQRLRDAYLTLGTTDRTSAALTVGAVYTREDLARMFNITDATLNTGIFQPKGTRSIWIFVTEKKTPDRTQYRDHLDGNTLHWQGQTEGRKDVLIIEHAQRDLELLLLVFYRHEKYEHSGAGFRYEGLFEYVEHKGNRPTNFVLQRAVPEARSPEVSDALVAMAAVGGRKGKGQGFRISPEARRAVEWHAMQTVEAYYRQLGWDVDASVAATECFDLRCTRGAAELHVEVKGTVSLGQEIVLTRNEVAHAHQQYPAMALAIVRNIVIELGDPPQAHGGTLGIIEPWRPEDGTLECLAFSYTVPMEGPERKR